MHVGDAGHAGRAAAEDPPVAKLAAKPADGATGVPVKDPVTITVTEGALDSAELISPRASPSRASWPRTS
ncbi:hypothetical protein ACFQV2_36445 [Actinokineospora soli]|uniref:Uncharacterized protein n=1 Tax=Actinokineospora soli TaxID=1048753 RepID=A0ABW2TXM8_9PSEU